MPLRLQDDVELYYEERGAGPALVFLHGLGSSSADWQLQLDHFAARYHCLAFDLPGSGRSRQLQAPHGPFSLAGFAQAVAQALRGMGVAPAHVVGLSMGGMTGLQLAVDHPDVVRSLVVTNATSTMKPRTLREAALLGVRYLVTRFQGPAGVARLVGPRLFPDPAHGPLRDQFIRQLSAQDPSTYFAVTSALSGWSVDDQLPRIACPVLFVSSDQDYTPVAYKVAAAARIPQGKVKVIANAHHAVPVERPEAFNAVVDEWLAGLPS